MRSDLYEAFHNWQAHKKLKKPKEMGSVMQVRGSSMKQRS
jgi:hypothetical protein